jgi:hypothetical protein
MPWWWVRYVLLSTNSSLEGMQGDRLVIWFGPSERRKGMREGDALLLNRW